MIRLVSSVVVPLLLPTALYFLYAWFVVRRARAQDPSGNTPPPDIDVPWSWLAIVGVVLAIASLAINFVDSGAGKPGAHYEPAHMENGKLVPGRTTE